MEVWLLLASVIFQSGKEIQRHEEKFFRLEECERKLIGLSTPIPGSLVESMESFKRLELMTGTESREVFPSGFERWWENKGKGEKVIQVKYGCYKAESSEPTIIDPDS